MTNEWEREASGHQIIPDGVMEGVAFGAHLLVAKDAEIAALRAEVEALKRDRAMLARVWRAYLDEGSDWDFVWRAAQRAGLASREFVTATPDGQRLAELGREG